MLLLNGHPNFTANCRFIGAGQAHAVNFRGGSDANVKRFAGGIPRTSSQPAHRNLESTPLGSLAVLDTYLPTGAHVTVVASAGLKSLLKESTALPSGAVVRVLASSGLASRVKESTALPTGAHVTVVGAAPSARVKESSALVAGTLTVVGAAPSARVKESSALPTGAVLAIHGAAPGAVEGKQPAIVDLFSFLMGDFAATQILYSSELPLGTLVVVGGAPHARVSESAILATGTLVIHGQAPTAHLSENSALPTGAVLALAGHAPTANLLPTPAILDLWSFLQGNFSAIDVTHFSQLPAGALEIHGAAPSGSVTTGEIEAPVFVPAPSGGGSFHYDSAAPLLVRPGFCYLPSGQISIHAFVPQSVVTANHRACLHQGVWGVSGAAPRARTTGNVRGIVPTAIVSTKCHAPAIFVTKGGIAEDELLCLMLL